MKRRLTALVLAGAAALVIASGCGESIPNLPRNWENITSIEWNHELTADERTAVIQAIRHEVYGTKPVEQKDASERTKTEDLIAGVHEDQLGIEEFLLDEFFKHGLSDSELYTVADYMDSLRDEDNESATETTGSTVTETPAVYD